MLLYNVFKHKKKNFYVCYPQYNVETPEHKSLRILRNTLKSTSKKWNLFITLTYNNLNVDNANPNDVRKMLNNLKQHNRNKKKDYLNDLIKYVWKVEFDSKGERDYNPHFHLLMQMPHWVSAPLVRKWWNRGYIFLEKITSRKKALTYIQKYFSKESDRKEWHHKRWSKSRNIKTVRTQFKFWGLMTREYAIELYNLSLEAEIDGHLIGYEIQKVIKSWSAERDEMAQQQIRYLVRFKSELRPW